MPVLISFAQIIFRDHYFQTSDNGNTINYLIKLVILSSTVHQCCFSLMSDLPFAVGQVQRRGLDVMTSSVTFSDVTLLVRKFLS